jgi:hypothetical protein
MHSIFILYLVANGFLLLKVDFRSLDQATIKPLGVYGSIPAIIKLWDELDLIGPET